MAKVLVPIDLEHESSWKKAVPIAADQARMMGGTVHLMTVVPHMSTGVDWRYAIRGETGGSLVYDINEIVDEALVRLTELRDKLVPAELRGEVLATHGTIYQQIVEAADALPADLIVMTSHRPSLKDFLLGPNAARVARHAKASVYLVRE